MRAAVGPQIPRRVVHNHLHANSASLSEKATAETTAQIQITYDAALVVGAPDAHAVRAPEPAEDDLHHTDALTSHTVKKTPSSHHTTKSRPRGESLRRTDESRKARHGSVVHDMSCSEGTHDVACLGGRVHSALRHATVPGLHLLVRAVQARREQVARLVALRHILTA